MISVMETSLFWHQQTHIAMFIFFSYTMHYNFHCVLSHCTLHVSLSFCWLFLKASALHLSDSPLFRERSTSDQLNVQDTMAENEEQYILSNIIYIQFQNCYFFL